MLGVFVSTVCPLLALSRQLEFALRMSAVGGKADMAFAAANLGPRYEASTQL
jgi:hypothetical protein